MTAARPPAPVRWNRLWSLATYPARLGPSRPERPSGAFARLALVHALSSAGDAWVTVALAGSVFVSVSLHAARGRTALGLVCTVLPFLVVGPLLGPVIDRVKGGRRAIVAASAVGRLVACGFMAVFIHSLFLFPAAFASLVCSKTYLVAKASLVPSAVDSDDDLVEANAKLAVGASVVTSAAALLGVGIYRVFGSGAVLHLDMVLLAGCALVAFRLRPLRADRLPSWPWSTTSSAGDRWSPPPLAGTPAGGAAAARPRGRTSRRRSGYRTLPHGGLVLAGMAMTAMRAVAGLLTALVLFAFRRDNAPLLWYGLVGVTSVAGNLVGASLAPLVRNRMAEERIVPTAAFVIGLAAVAVTQIHGMHRWLAAVILAASVGIGASVAKMAFDAIVQRDPPELARSRLFARSEALFQLGWVLAALIPVLIPLSLMTGFIIVAVLSLGAGIVFVVGWRKARLGTLPSWFPGGPQPAMAGPGSAVPGSGGSGSGPGGSGAAGSGVAGSGVVGSGHPPTTIAGPVGTGPAPDPTRRSGRDSL